MLLKTLLALYAVLSPDADVEDAEGLLASVDIAEDLLPVVDMAEGLLLVVLRDQRPVEDPPERVLLVLLLVLLVLLLVLPVSKVQTSFDTLCCRRTG